MDVEIEARAEFDDGPRIDDERAFDVDLAIGDAYAGSPVRGHADDAFRRGDDQRSVGTRAAAANRPSIAGSRAPSATSSFGASAEGGTADGAKHRTGRSAARIGFRSLAAAENDRRGCKQRKLRPENGRSQHAGARLARGHALAIAQRNWSSSPPR